MSQHTLTPTPDLSLPSPLMHPDTDVVNGIHYRKIHKPAPRTRNSTPPAWAWQHGQTYSWLDDDELIVRAIRCHHYGDMIKLHQQRVSNFNGHIHAKHEALTKMATLTVAGSTSAPSSQSSKVRPHGTKQLYFTPDVERFRKLLVR